MLSHEKNMVAIRVEFDQDEFHSGMDKTCAELSHKVSVPGFRKGHIPKKILEMRLGKEAIRVETLESMLPKAIDQVVQDHGLDLIDEPKVQVDSLDEDAPVAVTLTFEVSPEVVLPDISQIAVERKEASVSEESVDQAIRELRLQASTLSAVEDRPAGEDDLVDIEYHTIIWGPESEEERHGPDTTTIDLMQPSIHQEIRQTLLEKNKGDTAVAEVHVGEDYSDKNLAGKTMRYEMTVTDIRKRILPEMNQDFFSKVLQKECADEESFRTEVRTRLLERVQEEHQARAEYDAVEKVTAMAALEVPETLIGRQETAMKREDEERARRTKDMTLDQLLEASSLPREEYDKNIRGQAEAIVRRSLVLDKVAEERQVTVEKEDFEAEMAALASAYQIDAERLVKSLFKDENRMIEMANKIKYRKTVAAIMEAVQITDGAPGQQEAPGGGDPEEKGAM